MAGATAMTLALYDKGGGRFYDEAGPAGRAVFGQANVKIFTRELVQRSVDPLRAFSHIVCHLESGNEEEPSWQTLVQGDLERVAVIVRVSSVGAIGMEESCRPPYRLAENGPWVLHLIERSCDVKEGRWKEIFKSIRALAYLGVSPSSEISAIFDPHPEDRLALRLLCEAWLYASEPARKPGDLPIEPPAKPETWFAPFDKTPCREAAAEISGQMGAAMSAAHEFLQRVARIAEGNGEVSWAEFESDIRALRDALKGAAR